MAIRFASFETYKGALADKNTGKTSTGGVFIGTFQRQYTRLKDLISSFAQLGWVLASPRP